MSGAESVAAWARLDLSGVNAEMVAPARSSGSALSLSSQREPGDSFHARAIAAIACSAAPRRALSPPLFVFHLSVTEVSGHHPTRPSGFSPVDQRRQPVGVIDVGVCENYRIGEGAESLKQLKCGMRSRRPPSALKGIDDEPVVWRPANDDRLAEPRAEDYQQQVLGGRLKIFK